MRTSLLPAFALVLALAACEAPQTLSPDFGASVRANMAAQIINPTPTLDDAALEQDGRRAGDAWERYRTGTVYRPRSMSTSDGLIKTESAR